MRSFVKSKLYFSIASIAAAIFFIACSTTTKTENTNSVLINSEFANTARTDYSMKGKNYAFATQGILSTKAAQQILELKPVAAANP